VSVPGQDRWLHRRAHLLDRADVIVFVGDTSAQGWPATLARLRELRLRLDAAQGPAVGVVFQANRRDAADAIPIDVVRQQAGSERVAVVESVALDGTGVREAFVFAIRLALDRVREEQRLGVLPQVSVEAAGTELLRQLKALDPAQRAPSTLPSAPAPAASEPVTTPAQRAPRDEGPRRLPSHEAPSGLVWPPVEGRILLRNAMSEGAQTEIDADGDYFALLESGHRAHSSSHAHFSDLDAGRDLLIGWARRHVSAQGILSKGRCIVLSGSAGNYRLWQVVRVEPSLRELFVDGCENMIPRHAARQLATAGRLLNEAHAFCASHDVPLPCTLDTIGVSDIGQAIFVGDFPFGAGTAPPLAEQLAHELARLLQQRPAAERAELYQALRSFQTREHAPTHGASIAELLSQLIAP
jgi:hypothetical protein